MVTFYLNLAVVSLKLPFEAPQFFCTSRLPSRYMVQAQGATAKPLAWFQLADEKAAHLELLAALRCEGLK